MARIAAHKLFSEEQKQQIGKLYDEGKTQKEIGDVFGVARRVIMKVIQELGKQKDHSEAQKSRIDPEFEARTMELRASGKTMEEIATELGRSISAVGRVIAKNGDNKPPEEEVNEESVIISYQAGASIAKLSQRFGVSEYIIRNILTSHGVEIRPAFMSGVSPKPQTVDLPPFEDTKEWWEPAYAKYGVPSLANFTGMTRYAVRKRIKELGMAIKTLSESTTKIDSTKIIADYAELGSMSLVAARNRCAIQSVKNCLNKHDITIRTTPEIMSGEGNPFYGKEHPEDVVERCREAGIAGSIKFWEDNPEYRKISSERLKKLWVDPVRRQESSRKISELRKQGKCNSHKGIVNSRFGEIPFDSSYELSFIEWCENHQDIVHLERDFMVIEYEYNGSRCFVPDFQLWLSNGDFLVVEVKSDWFAKQPKERAKIEAGFDHLLDRLMIAGKKGKNDDGFSLVHDRIQLSLKPQEFDFDDIIVESSSPEDYARFYAAFHYLGNTGRRGYTIAGMLHGKMVAAASFSSLTRNESATKLGTTPDKIRELSRFCIHPDYRKKNFGSWFMSRAIKAFLRDHTNVDTIITFADTTVGHTGGLYTASNWTYDGDTKSSYKYVDKNGTIIHKKTVYDQAIRNGYREREWAEHCQLVKVPEKPKKRFIYRR